MIQTGKIRKRFFLGRSGRFVLSILLITALLPVATFASEKAIPLGPMLAAEGGVWQMEADTFVSVYRELGFVWQSDAHDSARAFRKSLSFLDMPIWESSVRFEHGRPRQITLFLYTRGDAGLLTKEQFRAKLETAQEKINIWTGVQAQSCDDQLKTTGVKRRAKIWRGDPYAVRMVWSYSTKDSSGRFSFRPEYIRVELVPSAAAPAGSLVRSRARDKTTVPLADLRAAVQRQPNGDRVIAGIPMVDQGEKGYCAVAVAERVFRYFGIEVDQHEMAQLVATTSTGGTSHMTMIDVLKRAGVKLGCKIKVLESFDVDDFKKMVQRYNRLARKQDKPQIQLGPVIHISEVYQQMDRDLLHDVRMKFRGDYQRFQKDIIGYIDSGNPLAWSVMLGKVDEIPAVRGTGGHMRLIIGYNSRTSELIYSDTWGKGHEMKRMDLADAWSITTGLIAITPRYTKR